jgi:hypothetical protein
MAVRRSGRFSLREDRQLIQVAVELITLEEAAATFGSSVATIIFRNIIGPVLGDVEGDDAAVRTNP